MLIEFYYSLYTICPGNIETRIFCRWHQNIYVSLSFFSHFLLFFLLTIEELWIRKIWIDSNRKHFVVHTHNCCTSKNSFKLTEKRNFYFIIFNLCWWYDCCCFLWRRLEVGRGELWTIFSIYRYSSTKLCNWM